MPNILFVIPDLDYRGPARQLVDLLLALPTDCRRRVCVLGRGGPWVAMLREAGVAVDLPGTGRPLDARPLVYLRRLAGTDCPDVVHAWGLSALRAVALSGMRGRRVVSPFLNGDKRRSLLGRLDGWLLRRADRVITFGAAEADRCRAMGVTDGKDRIVAAGVWNGTLPPAADIPGVPAGAPVVLCVGPLEMRKGFLEAIWAFDILRFVRRDLHLVLAGGGSARPRLERFAADLGATEYVHFLGPRDDVPALLRRADVVWSPGRRDAGARVVLEAMAAGRPVVANRWPCLAALVDDGKTGYLVPPGDKAALARQTQALLASEPLRRELGAAAHRRAAEHFPADRLAEQCARVYLE